MGKPLRNTRHQSKFGPPFHEGFCALAVRTMFDAPSSGDADKDGDADAVDVWVRSQHRHRVGVRAMREGFKFPREVPVVFAGGSEGFGHIVIATGYGRGENAYCWSTDIHRTGYFDHVKIGEVLDWGSHFVLLGWVEDLGGKRIYTPPAPPKKGK